MPPHPTIPGLPCPPQAEPPSLERALRVLVAEDVAPTRALLRLLIESGGHDVILTAHGAEALAEVQRQRFDIALLDLRMPVMDGLATARAIRCLPLPLCRLPMLAMTAASRQEVETEVLAAGFDGILAKPFDPAELLDALTAYAARGEDYTSGCCF